jgi:hypothetical protein
MRALDHQHIRSVTYSGGLICDDPSKKQFYYSKFSDDWTGEVTPTKGERFIGNSVPGDRPPEPPILRFVRCTFSICIENKMERLGEKNCYQAVWGACPFDRRGAPQCLPHASFTAL